MIFPRSNALLIIASAPTFPVKVIAIALDKVTGIRLKVTATKIVAVTLIISNTTVVICSDFLTAIIVVTGVQIELDSFLLKDWKKLF